MKALSLVRPNIQKLVAYESARSLNVSGECFLDANELPWGDFRRYPDPQPTELKERLCAFYGVDEKQICITRGTDEAIDVIVRSLCEPEKDSVLMCPPTYGMYQVSAQIQGANIVEVPLTVDLQPNLDKITEAVATSGVKLVFLCSPNNPSGNTIPRSTVEDLSERIGDRALIVMDEAYIEFSEIQSSSQWNLPNVLVLRTLSKAWGLAGIRIGSLIGPREWIEVFQKVRAPYPLSAPSVSVAIEALSERGTFIARVEDIKKKRSLMEVQLSRLSFVTRVYPSEANFILIGVKSATQVMEAAKREGIILRNRSYPFWGEAVRITMGKCTENEKLMNVLSRLEKS